MLRQKKKINDIKITLDHADNIDTQKKRKRKIKEAENITDENSNTPVNNYKKKKPESNNVALKQNCIDHKENVDLDTEESQENAGDNNEAEKKHCSIPVKDMLEIIARINSLIPENDFLSYKSRIEKLNWEEVKFANYSVEDCKDAWTVLQKPVRKFRTLKEILLDAKDYLANPAAKGRRIKLPDMPVKPSSSYMIFYKKKKDKLLADNPGLDFGELSHQISQMFKALPAEKKIKYDTKAAKAKAEYEQQLKEFYDNHPELERPPEKARKEKLIKEVDRKPRKPLTPFFLFYESRLQEERKLNGDIKDKATIKEACKEEWKELIDEKKLIWINWAEKDLQRYEDEVKQYMETHPDFVPISVKHVLSKDEVHLRDRLLGKPEKPPNSAYSVFSKMMLQSEEIKQINSKERMNFIATQWKNSNDDFKDIYKKLQIELQEKYNKEYEKYVESLPEEKRLMEQKKTKKRKNENEDGNKKAPSKNNKKSKKLQEPETPPLSAIRYFANEFKYDPKTAKKKWKALSPEEREQYEKKLMKIKKDYILQFEKFLTSLSKTELVEYSNNKKTTQFDDEFLDVDSVSSSTSASEESSDEADASDNDSK